MSEFGFCCCDKLPYPDQFRKEGVYFSSQLQVTFLHVRVVMAAGTWGRELHLESRAESSVFTRACCLLSFSDLRHQTVQDPMPKLVMVPVSMNTETCPKGNLV